MRVLAAILERLGDHHAAHMDLGGRATTARARSTRPSATCGARWSSGTRCRGSRYNYLACIAAQRGDVEGMKRLFTEATRRDPQHWVADQRTCTPCGVVRAAGAAKGLPLELDATHDFQLLERTAQPTLPGPLPDDFASGSPPPPPPARPVGMSKADPRKLRVVTA